MVYQRECEVEGFASWEGAWVAHRRGAEDIFEYVFGERRAAGFDVFGSG